MDKYDKNIAELLDHPEWTHNWWMSPIALFDHCNGAGCLTQVRGKIGGDNPSKYNLTPEIFGEIQKDHHIHSSPNDLQRDIDLADSYAKIVEILYPYAEWQRRLNKIYPGRILSS